MNGSTHLRAAWAVALGLLTLAGGVQASPPAADKEKVKDKQVVRHEQKERRRIAVVNHNGEEQVIDLDALGTRRGYLGVALTDLTPELRTHFGAPEDAGVMIAKVEPGSPAEKAGIKVGDVLTSVDGKGVKSSWDVHWRVRTQEEGTQVPLEVWRNGKVQTLSATVEKRERPEIDMAPFFFKDEDGDRMVLRLDRDKLMTLPDKVPTWEGSVPGPGPRMRVERRGATPREAELEKKLKDLEKRIAELEKQLQKNR